MSLLRYWKGLPREVEHSVHTVDEDLTGYSPEHPSHIRPALSRGWGRDPFSTLNCSVTVTKEQCPVVSLFLNCDRCEMSSVYLVGL